MCFRGLDLNLLAVFNGLMWNHSVSAAARQMHLSQPAMSAANVEATGIFR
jgi:LysR family nod box-dependent transcriptional activator